MKVWFSSIHGRDGDRENVYQMWHFLYFSHFGISQYAAQHGVVAAQATAQLSHERLSRCHGEPMFSAERLHTCTGSLRTVLRYKFDHQIILHVSAFSSYL